MAAPTGTPSMVSTSKISFQEAIHIQVGPEDDNPGNFIVHRELLLTTADLFHATNVVNVREPDERTFKFGNRDPHHFGLYIRWLYKQAPQLDDFNDLIGAYLFATMLVAPAFQNYVIRLMYTKLVSAQSFPSAEQLNKVWEDRKPESPLRKLLLDVSIWGKAQPTVGWGLLLRDVSSVFVRDYAMGQAAKYSQQDPLANGGVRRYEVDVPEIRRHPYHDHDTKLDTPINVFSEVMKLEVGAAGEAFYIHPSFFRRVDPLLSKLIDEAIREDISLVRPDMDPNELRTFIEWTYFRNDDEPCPFVLFAPVEEPEPPTPITPPAEPVSPPTFSTGGNKTVPAEAEPVRLPIYSNHRPPTLSSDPMDENPIAIASNLNGITAETANVSRHASPHEHSNAGVIPGRLPLPPGWGVDNLPMSSRGTRTYIDYITLVRTVHDPRCVGPLPKGWTVRLQRNGSLVFENSSTKAQSVSHPSDFSRDWTEVRLEVSAKGAFGYRG